MVQHVPNNTTIYIAIASGTVEKLYANWYNTSTINYGEKKKSTPVTFEAGKIYNLGKTSDWGEAVPTYKMAAEATDDDMGKLICSDGHIHAYGADAACTADRVAKIIYAGNSTDDATYKHGLALALNDEGYMIWSDTTYDCYNKNSSQPVTGALWKLPSKYQWEIMIGATGGYFALRDGFSSVGGTNMLESVGYWTSTEVEDDANWAVCLIWNGTFGTSLKNNKGQVRLCLAF